MLCLALDLELGHPQDGRLHTWLGGTGAVWQGDFPISNSQALAFNLSSFSWSSPLVAVGRGRRQPCPQGHWDRDFYPQGALPG